MSQVITFAESQKQLADTSASHAQSQLNTTSDERGQTHIDEDQYSAVAELYAVLLQCKAAPFTTKSNFARHHATTLAIAASEGLVSTRISDGTYANRWMITADGIYWIEEVQDVFGF